MYQYRSKLLAPRPTQNDGDGADNNGLCSHCCRQLRRQKAIPIHVGCLLFSLGVVIVVSVVLSSSRAGLFGLDRRSHLIDARVSRSLDHLAILISKYNPFSSNQIKRKRALPVYEGIEFVRLTSCSLTVVQLDYLPSQVGCLLCSFPPSTPILAPTLAPTLDSA